jgi:UDP-2,3-diacylglucosamine pyrophosphatase LpxH
MASSARRYLILSDLHLCDVENHADGWKLYKASQFVFDAELDALVDHVLADTPAGCELTLLLNGDIFDFDLVVAVPDSPPWPVSAPERKYGLDATQAKSAWKLERMLADHPRFVRTLARLIAAGHRIVYVLGNHDREFHFAEVREVLLAAVAGELDQGHRARLPEAFRFEPWFYFVPGEVYAEHGNQYDFYCSFKYLLVPVEITHRGEERLALPMGNVSNRYLLSNIGFFNPHEDAFILSAFGYVGHWLRHYAFNPRRYLVVRWLVGSLRTIFHVLKTKKRLARKPPHGHPERLAAVAERFALPVGTVERLERLKLEPITSRLYKMVRELWIDRLALGLGFTGGTIALALAPIPLWIQLMVPLTTFPLLHFIYEWFAGADNARTVEVEAQRHAHDIGSLLPVRVIAFGHTHLAGEAPIARGLRFVNSGTWAPQWGNHPGTLSPGLRNYVVLTFGEHPEPTVEVGSWMPLGSSHDAPGHPMRTRR